MPSALLHATWQPLLLLLPATVWGQGSDSCAGHCGNWAADCWCNQGCEQRGDCCPDYHQSCPPLQLRKLDQSDAVCLDGSPGGYYQRTAANSTNWLIYFEGGGWCYDPACSPQPGATLQNCRERSGTSLGSSAGWTETREYGGMLSANRRANPVFYGWNLVYAPYCDGDSFSGNASLDGLHFKGRVILRAMIEQLLKTSGIRSADTVVLAGGSAGGTTVLYHADQVADQLGLLHGRVLGMPDAGFFLDLPDRNGTDCWPNQMRSLFGLSGGLDGLHAGCLSKHGKEPWRCLFPEYYVELIKTPMMLIQSLYDSSELWYTLRLGCCPAGCSSYPKCGAADMARFLKLREQHMAAWGPLVKQKGNGVWAPACIAHTMTEYEWTDQSWAVPGGSGNTMAVAVWDWLTGRASPRYEDEVEWPHNEPCARSDID